MKIIGLDVGTNSVGSAWIDTGNGLIHTGVSIFPAGIEASSERGRGDPKNQARRRARQTRRRIQRLALRKKKLREVLVQHDLLPGDAIQRKALFDHPTITPWHLRRKGLYEELTPYEFGRVLTHLNQRRGTLGVRVEPHEEADEATGKKPKDEAEKEKQSTKEGIVRAMKWLNGRTFGEAMAEKLDSLQIQANNLKKGNFSPTPIRNRNKSYEYIADRSMIHDEFQRLWKKQSSFKGPLAPLLTDDLRSLLDQPDPSQYGDAQIWRYGGILFGQRKYYWNISSLGRCELEPTDRGCPEGDSRAQYFRVLCFANTIRIEQRDFGIRALTPEERAKVIAAMRSSPRITPAGIKKALGIDKKSLKAKGESEDYYRLNLDQDEKADIHGDWFQSCIVVPVWGEKAWSHLDERTRSSINRAVLKFQIDQPGDEAKLRQGAATWWKLDPEQIERFIAAWAKSPSADRRLNLSARAISNLLPYLENPHDIGGEQPGWHTVTTARQAFAEDPGNRATPEQRVRYAWQINDRVKQLLHEASGGETDKVARWLALRFSNKYDRHFVAKHPGKLPPPPILSNPVVRKAIYVVRDHIQAYMDQYGQKPDRIVIELARDASKTKTARDRELKLIKDREAKRKEIVDKYKLSGESPSQREKAIRRVLLCMQQNRLSAYSNTCITEQVAARGYSDEHGPLEIDHIVPRSRGGEDGLNNRVLCYAHENREKGNQTPVEWLSKEAFEGLESRFEKCLHKPDKTSPATAYFTKGGRKLKWKNLHRKGGEINEDWAESQLTDTAYAAREVATYLHAALFPDEPIERKGGCRRILFTNGAITAELRRDWGLSVTHGQEKDRADHRHHAIDAAIIAMTSSKVVYDLANARKDLESRVQEYKRAGKDPSQLKRHPILPPKPWSDLKALYQKVVDPMFARNPEGIPIWAVAHTPVKRRICGAFHMETLFGMMNSEKGHFTVRVPIAELAPAYFDLSQKQKQDLLMNRYPVAQDDPPLGRNSYLIRDPSLRVILRNQLLALGVDVDTCSKTALKAALTSNAFSLPSGVPIKKVVCYRTIAEPVIYEYTSAVDPEHREVNRVYMGRNTHHVEIRETSEGKWKGCAITMNDVAAQNALKLKALHDCKMRYPDESERNLRKQCLRRTQLDFPLVNRRDTQDGRFVMSLCEGETLLMKNPETGLPDVFAVVKIAVQGPKIAFKHHSIQKGPDKPEKTSKDVLVTSSSIPLIEITPGSLLGKHSLPNGSPPRKVKITPLGSITFVDRD
ncbi:MAG TPA: type II CRISPR RNA-guided endonuclease Cas9 [Kiritimatiellia bacterium]|nr:type II CRISPR RNA-guided endonuclease Cas9 [Kiritimatiellia bacterium]